MLEIRPICENCGKKLPNESTEAMICSFECTFCMDCVTEILQNVCPNCGGGFERRPVRPNRCITPNCVDNYPVATEEKFRPIDIKKFEPLQKALMAIAPMER